MRENPTPRPSFHVTLRLRWRHFWAQRGRSRLALVLILLAGSVITTVAAFFPPEWWTAMQLATQSIAVFVDATDSSALLLKGGGVLFIITLIVLLTPLRRPHPFHTTTRSLIAPVAVYLDEENQLSHQDIRAFIDFLRQQLGGQHADLFFFTDSSKTEKHGEMYRRLWQFGFRPVDIPHKALDIKSKKNIVDLELSLFAYERALFAPQPQHIIIVAADQDYFPLVYRLWSRGHTVSIWGRGLTKSYYTLHDILGIQVVDLADVLPKAHAAAEVVPPLIEPQGTAHTAGPSLASEPAKTPIAWATLQFAIQETQQFLDKPLSSKNATANPLETYKSQIGNMHHNLLGRLGYQGSLRINHWLMQMDALGVVIEQGGQALPRVGPISPQQAVSYLHTFLQEVVALATAMAAQDAQHYVDMNKLARRLKDPHPDDSPPIAALRRLMSDPTAVRHASHLCQCARKLQLIDFTDTKNSWLLHIVMPTTP